tara:strand:+ start:1017 stop:1745 length:729 start_codon:yes stop_codon:yes gene_type:complete
MKTYGLIGFPLNHSFSKKYFTNKFRFENIDAKYINIEIESLDCFKELVIKNNLLGLNVTIPYKSRVLDFLDYTDNTAKKIGAVNTIKIVDDKLYGYNTDVIGFEKSIKPLLDNRKDALILGNGGVSKAIQFILKKLEINYKIVSRNSSFDYSDINESFINTLDIVINTTPLGTYPKINTAPNLPYSFLNSKHLLFDVVYNPMLSLFLNKGKEQGCVIKNGLEMLQIQADESWNIWNSKKINL